MAEQKQDDQHGHTFSNYVSIQDVVQKTCLRRWTIGKSDERESGISVLPARHEDDDDTPIRVRCHITILLACSFRPVVVLSYHLVRLLWSQVVRFISLGWIIMKITFFCVRLTLLRRLFMYILSGLLIRGIDHLRRQMEIRHSQFNYSKTENSRTSQLPDWDYPITTKFLNDLGYKSFFSKEKIKLTTCGNWFGRSGEGRSNPRQYGTKKWLPLYELLFRPSVRIRGPNCEGTKNLSLHMGFVTRFLNEASQEMKVDNLNSAKFVGYHPTFSTQ